MAIEKFLYEKTQSFKGKDYTTRYYRVSYCPICGSKKQRCMRVETNGTTTSYMCKYSVSSKSINTAIGECYIHEVDNSFVEDLKSRKVISLDIPSESPMLTPEILELRNSVYREYRSLIKKYTGSFLYERDKEDLLKRGLSEDLIERMGFFSMPSPTDKVYYGDTKVKLITAIVKDLENIFSSEELLKVPGFIKRTYNSSDYITISTKQKDKDGNWIDSLGYYIPYSDENGLWNSMQKRLTVPIVDEKGKLMRYLWFSSPQASSGSPIDYYIPKNLKRDDIMLITEGALKGQIASEYLGFEGLFEAGVGNYRALVKKLGEIESVIGKKYKVIVALDMDKISNPDVIHSENETIKLLRATGHQVAIAEWNGNKAKGIDDAIILGLNINYKLI